jgi:HK97 family phage major capsid protein
MAYDNITDRTDAAALIPEETSNEIIQDLPRASAAMSMFRSARMSRKQQRVPVLSILPQAYFVNGDTGLKQTTEQNWENKFLNAEELACIVPIPEAVLDDSEFDMWAEIKPRVVEAIGAAIDAAVFFGLNKPASWPDSIVALAAAAGNSFTRGSVGGQKLDVDISDTMKLVEDDGYDVNGFVARKNIKGGLRGLRTSEGALIFQPTLQAKTPDTLYGESIFYSQNGAWVNAQADLISGDYMQAVLAARQDITYKLLTEAVIQDASGAIVYNLAQQDMVALRVVIRTAYQVPNPVNRMQTDSGTRCPFAVLRPTGFVA